MASRSEREKSKIQEKYQVILSQMLREEDNKYCVDCDTKSKDRYKNDRISQSPTLFFQVLDGLVGISVYLYAFVVLVFIEI